MRNGECPKCGAREIYASVDGPGIAPERFIWYVRDSGGASISVDDQTFLCARCGYRESYLQKDHRGHRRQHGAEPLGQGHPGRLDAGPHRPARSPLLGWGRLDLVRQRRRGNLRRPDQAGGVGVARRYRGSNCACSSPGLGMPLRAYLRSPPARSIEPLAAASTGASGRADLQG